MKKHGLSESIEWKIPVITVIIRNKPAENLLLNCKTIAIGSSQGQSVYQCYQKVDENCNSCEGGVDS